MSAYKLIIGNKNFSSWSLRPWLLMRGFAIDFEEHKILMRTPDGQSLPGYREKFLEISPTGMVPALHDGDVVVWDTLAITEYLAECHKDLAIWPSDPKARALARCVSAEMHSGFSSLRTKHPMDFARITPHNGLTPAVEEDVRRIVAIWCDCRARFGSDGPHLFGEFSAADAMYAPVASRFCTFAIDPAAYGDTDGVATDYIARLFKLPAMQEWQRGAAEEIAQN